MSIQRKARRMTSRRYNYVSSPIERHTQTVIQVILVALLLWSGQAIIDLRDKMVRVETQLVAIHASQAAAASDRYSKTQAALEIGELKRILDQQSSVTERDITSLRGWMQSLRDRVIELEGFARAQGFSRGKSKIQELPSASEMSR